MNMESQGEDDLSLLLEKQAEMSAVVTALHERIARKDDDEEGGTRPPLQRQGSTLTMRIERLAAKVVALGEEEIAQLKKRGQSELQHVKEFVSEEIKDIQEFAHQELEKLKEKTEEILDANERMAKSLQERINASSALEYKLNKILDQIKEQREKIKKEGGAEESERLATIEQQVEALVIKVKYLKNRGKYGRLLEDLELINDSLNEEKDKPEE